MAKTLAAITLAATVLWASQAAACDCITLDPKGPHFASDLDRIAQFYPIAADGVLEKDGQFAWRFRPTHENRGLGKMSYRIELSSDCSLDPQTMNSLLGKPIFLLLAGGPDHFEAGRCVNRLGPDMEGAIRKRLTQSCPPH